MCYQFIKWAQLQTEIQFLKCYILMMICNHKILPDTCKFHAGLVKIDSGGQRRERDNWKMRNRRKVVKCKRAGKRRWGAHKKIKYENIKCAAWQWMLNNLKMWNYFNIQRVCRVLRPWTALSISVFQCVRVFQVPELLLTLSYQIAVSPDSLEVLLNEKDPFHYGHARC